MTSAALNPLIRGLMRAAPSALPRRHRILRGRHALVDGIPFTLPVNSERTPALMAGFRIDGDAAARLMPGGELHPVRLPGGAGVLLVTVINYHMTDIGKYVEYSLAVACTFGTKPAPPLLPALFRGRFGTGQYVIDLPVSSEISVKGGKGIWGMPKHQANLDFVISDATVSSQYEVDGLLGARIEIERPPRTDLPLDVSAVNYCTFRGMVMKSTVYFQGRADVVIGRHATGRLDLGDSPYVAPLRSLAIHPRPLFTAFLPSTHGVLDDHLEAWFVTSSEPISEPPEGLESVVDLGLSETWLDAPKLDLGALR